MGGHGVVKSSARGGGVGQRERRHAAAWSGVTSPGPVTRADPRSPCSRMARSRGAPTMSWREQQLMCIQDGAISRQKIPPGPAGNSREGISSREADESRSYLWSTEPEVPAWPVLTGEIVFSKTFMQKQRNSQRTWL